MTVRALIPTGFGVNCEAETSYALRTVGAEVDCIHLTDLLARGTGALDAFQIVVFAGGFSFGDHLGAGRVLSARWRHGLAEALDRFVGGGGLVLGICNGFQALVQLGLLPQGRVAAPTVSLAANQCGHFYDGWVRLRVDPESPCVFTKDLDLIELPVRHGEGRLVFAPDTEQQCTNKRLIPLCYVDATGEPTEQFPANPNGSAGGAAGLCDPSGRVFGLMPHPEAYAYVENHPDWRRNPAPPAGLSIFRNAVKFLS